VAPAFAPVELDLREAAAEGFRALERQAAEKSAVLETEIAGGTPDRILGDAAHIVQLLNSLPASLLHVAKPSKLRLCVSVKANPNSGADLWIESSVFTDQPARTLCERLTAILNASEALLPVPGEDGEMGLAACWQLVQALGGRAEFEPRADLELCLRLQLPVEVLSPFALSAVIPPRPAGADQGAQAGRQVALLPESSARPSVELEKEENP